MASHHATPPASRGAVLVVDDEPLVRQSVSQYLQRAGYDTKCAADGQEALDRAADWRPDVVVLDWKLQRVDGIEVVNRLRGSHNGGVGVIVLTSTAALADRISALRAGADDFLAKPCSLAELTLRVGALLRRIGINPALERPLAFGELRIDPPAREVRLAGAPCELTQREFDLVYFLARHPGRVFTRDQLMDLVWRYSFYTDTRTVTVHVRRLRAKIEPDPARPRYVETVWGKGYRFRA